jgi:hypothetical protein
MSAEARLRVLFFVGRPGYLRPYLSLIAELAARGHQVHLALPERPEGAQERLVAEATSPPGVTWGLAPRRGETDGWRSVAWLVRALADLARYSHPRYEPAPVLRRRITENVLLHLERPGDLDPAGRRLGLRLARRLAATTDAGLSTRVIRRAQVLEEAIPTSRAIDGYIRGRAPDLVLATPVVKFASEQIDLLRSARRLGVPTGVCVASWDNLTNKGLMRFVPERVFVWNEVQVGEAVELHGVPRGRVVATGAQLFDEWFERRPSVSREEFVRGVGLDPAEPYVLYVCSNPAMTDVPESGFVLGWARALRAGGDDRLRRIGILIRPHPNEPGQWRGVDLDGLGNAAVWPPEGALPVTDRLRAGFFDSLAHSAAVVGINTTAMIEGAIVGKSVLTVLAPEFAQESTLHFHYLLAENGGFLHVASSPEEHVAQLAGVLDEDAEGAERRRRFVESFVRPRGLDRPATPVLADAIEEAAGLPVDAPARASLPLRAALGVEAGLSSARLALSSVLRPVERLHVPRRLRRLRRRVGAKARGLAPQRP